MKYLFTLLVFTFSAHSCFSQTDPNLVKLKSDIQAMFQATPGNYALAFTDLSVENQEIYLDEHEEFHAASTMKVPVMMEVFKQAQAGKFSLSDSIVVKNQFTSIVDDSTFQLERDRDSDDSLYEKLGQKKRIEDLMVDMIIYSSNLATNLIIELVGAKNVQQSLRELGAKDFKVLRGVEDIKAYDAGLNNTTTAYDLMLLFEKIGQRKLVSESASDKMLEVLLRQTHNTIIPALLPTEIKVAHKTGSISGVAHDAGIVILPNGEEYVLVLLSKDMPDSETGVKMMAEVSRMIYDFIQIKNKK